MELTAGEKLAVPPPRRWKPWAWVAAALLHAAAIALLLWLTRNIVPPFDALSPNGVSVVFQNGAQPAQPPQHAPVPTPQLAPPPPAAPAAPQTAEAAPEVNLAIPQNLLAPDQMPAPPTPPQPATRAPATHGSHAAAHPRPSQKYMVMNNMSFGNSTAPPVPFSQRDLNLSLPQSDADAVFAPEVSIRGNVGKNWGAAFNKWVYAHLYYPDEAIRNDQQGDVTVEFTAHRDGSVTGLHMLSGSGSPFLDQGWTGIFANNQLPPFPPGGSDTVDIIAKVHYEIEN